jgi:type VI secretion system protein ImpH
VRPRTSPVFPASDIERVEVAPDGTVTAEVTFMGLYGPSPALPRYFTEPIAHDEADALRAFLDLFGGRLYGLYHEAWRKYRPRARFTADGAGEAQAPPDDAMPFVALAGVPPATGIDGVPIPPLRLAALAGRLGARARNAAGLRDLLAHFLGVPAAIEENHPRWVTAPWRGRLGAPGDAGVRLGQGALLGGRIYDVSGKARVVLGPLDIEEFRSLLPGGDRAALAAGLVRFYLPDGLDFDVELRLREAQTHPLVLGDGASRLGRNAWVGRTGPGLTSQVISYA